VSSLRASRARRGLARITFGALDFLDAADWLAPLCGDKRLLHRRRAIGWIGRGGIRTSVAVGRRLGIRPTKLVELVRAHDRTESPLRR